MNVISDLISQELLMLVHANIEVSLIMKLENLF